MIFNPEKAQIKADLHAERNSYVGKVLQKYVTMRVQEVREQNDSAEVKDVPRNQGRIAELLELLDVLERGLPIMDK